MKLTHLSQGQGTPGAWPTWGMPWAWDPPVPTIASVPPGRTSSQEDMFWSWLWGLAVRKAGLLKGVPEGQVNSHTAGAVGVARTCAKTVCVAALCGGAWPRVGGGGVVCCVCSLPLVNSVWPASGHSGSDCESHVDCILVTYAPVTTGPPWSNRGASYSCKSFCVCHQSLCRCELKHGCESRWLSAGWTQGRPRV